MSSTPRRKTIAVDFDGVLHSYSSGWHGVLTIADPPVRGAIEWLTAAVARYKVVIHTARLLNGTLEGETTPGPHKVIAAIEQWLAHHDCPLEVVDQFNWHTGCGKPHAHVYLDDRGLCFDGVFPSFEIIDNFKPWNKQG